MKESRIPSALTHTRAFGILIATIAVTGCAPSPKGPDVTSACLGISYPASTELTLLGAYQGPRIKVVSGWFEKPQIIVVSGYEAIDWNFSDFSRGELLGVIAYGYERPTISNTPADVPVRIVSYRDEQTGNACGKPMIAFRGGLTMDAFAAQAEKLTGLVATRARGEYESHRLDAGAQGQQDAVVDPHADRSEGDTRPGRERLEPLIARGVIRAATTADVEAFNAKATATLKTGRLIAYADESLRPNGAYVVLKRFSAPPGMYGANSRFFIVSTGVPKPVDNGSHNSYYFMDDGRCIGPGSASWSDCPGSMIE